MLYSFVQLFLIVWYNNNSVWGVTPNAGLVMGPGAMPSVFLVIQFVCLPVLGYSEKKGIITDSRLQGGLVQNISMNGTTD